MSENDMARIARLVADPLADARAEVQGLLVEHERLTLELIATRARVAKLEAALKDIAKQELEEELHPDFHGGDYRGAYEVIIKEARAALKDAPQ